MSYKALYRTYRPSTFEEVAGQQHIVRTLKNALSNNKIAHAYLFTGPRGTGKTTMAKLFAKALNCEEGLGHQCNNCKNCKSIMDGTHPDVLELDAASNNGVDNIRELIDNVKYGTILGKYKVYIIDEVHMLSTGAFNALLKTLEEPPENVIFILATTEPHKVLPTILSRCQRYDFTKVSDEDTRNRIKTILEQEHISYNETAINLIIKMADGGMRDALSILDQVLAYSGGQLDERDVLDIFALESVEEKINLLKSLISKDVNDVLNRLNKYVSKGSDLKRLTEDLLTMLKDILIFKTSRNAGFLEIFSFDEVKEFSNTVTEKELLDMIDALMQANKDYKNVTSIAPIFEITLLKIANIAEGNHSFKNEEPVKEVKPVEKEIKEEPVVETAPVVEDKNIEVVSPLFEMDEPEVKIQEEKPVEKEIIEPQPEPEEIVQPEPTVIEEEKPVVEPQPQPQIAPAPKPIFIEPVPLPRDDDDKYSDFDNPVTLNESILEIDGFNYGECFDISNEDLLKMIVISKKEIKNSLIENWQKIKPLTAHKDLSKYASLLIDGRPLVASEKFVVIEYQLPSIATRANLTENQLGLQHVFQTAFNKRMFIYGINRSQSVDIQVLYKHMYQAGNLPKKEEINFKYLGE